MLIEFKEGKIVVVSTDQFALSRARADITSEECKAIMSANILQTFRGSPIQKAGPSKVKISDNHIYFSTKDVSCFRA